MAFSYPLASLALDWGLTRLSPHLHCCLHCIVFFELATLSLSLQCTEYTDMYSLLQVKHEASHHQRICFLFYLSTTFLGSYGEI